MLTVKMVQGSVLLACDGVGAIWCCGHMVMVDANGGVVELMIYWFSGGRREREMGG